MKSIADFVSGKIRRAEVEDQVCFEPGGEPHPKLGPCEGTLIGPGGTAAIFEAGMTVGESAFSYESIRRVEIGPGGVEVICDDRTVRIESSEAGGEVLHATLRWIGHTRLRRSIAD